MQLVAGAVELRSICKTHTNTPFGSDKFTERPREPFVANITAKFSGEFLPFRPEPAIQSKYQTSRPKVYTLFLENLIPGQTLK